MMFEDDVMGGQEDGDDQQNEIVFDGQQRRFAELLLEDGNLPEEAKDEFSAFFDKEMALTFLTERDVDSLLGQFDDTVVSMLMNKYPHQFSGQSEVNITQLRARLKAKLLRARGKGRHNERSMLATQIQQTVFEEPEAPSGGIMQKAVGGMRKAFGGGQR